jgi:formamidopyrimidine-DNA glycosylase
MPELPEVETVCRGLDALLPGRMIHAVETDWPKTWPLATGELESHVLGTRFSSVSRRGKLILAALDNGYCLAMHLRMTGQLVFVGSRTGRFGGGHPSDSLVDQLPDRSTRVIFRLDGGKLFFNDQRKFGRIQLVAPGAVDDLDFVKRLGPDPLDPAFTPAQLAEVLGRRAGAMIKAVLLDQSVIAGIGNIYTDEALWGARLHPAQPAGSLSADDVVSLWTELRTVLHLSIAQGGSTDRNYLNAEGQRGAYLDFARVFRRQGQACQRCGGSIIKLRCAGRGTHICPQCQKLLD